MRRDSVTLQLGITYKEMSLSITSGHPNLRVASGDRAPDAPGMNAEGKSIRLFDLFRGPHFTLLRLFAGDDLDHGTVPHVKLIDVQAGQGEPNYGRGIFVDAFGHLAAAYDGGHGEYVLVRPDGYIGWIGSREHWADLNGYLSCIFSQQTPEAKVYGFRRSMNAMPTTPA